MFSQKSKSDKTHLSAISAAEAGKSLIVQRQLTVGSVNDPLEHEADAIADEVIRMPEQNFVQRKCADCESEEKEKLHRKPLSENITPFIQTKSESNAVVNNSVVDSIQSSKGLGFSLDGNTKSFMSNRFNNDFSNVKIHADRESVQLSKNLNAKAFTVGNDIYFNEGQYQPGSTDGRHLLAHELTHVIQQGKGSQKIQKAAVVCDEYAQQQAGTYTPGPGITISWNGNAVSISANLELYGSAANATVAGQIKNSIENYWRGNFSNGYGVSASVNVSVRAAGASADSGRTQINCLPSSGVSNVMPSYWIAGSDMMTYYVGSANPSWTPAHEFGHLLGLGDRYAENWVAQIFGSQRASAPDAGWSGNIMAEVGGVVQERNIQELLYRYATYCSRSHLESPL